MYGPDVENAVKGLFSTVRDAVRTQLWPLPTAAVLVAVVLAFAVPRLDREVDSGLPGWLGSVLFSGDAGAASTLLDAISSSLISVTALTFSLTVVTLQLASSQFSPRLLRTFASDLFVQATLALFLSTFVFSLTVLRSVRSSTETSDQFVPRLAVTLAFVLAIASVFGLVLFLAHLTSQIRVETMLRNVHDEASSTLLAVLEERDADQPENETRSTLPEVPDRAIVLRAHASGFLTSIDLDSLLRCASHHGVLLVLEANMGSFMVRRSILARAWASEGGVLAEDVRVSLQDAVTEATHLGDERTAGHISALLCELADCRLGPIQLRDEDNAVRVIVQRPTFEELVEGTITQPRRYGASDPQVAARLASLLGDLAEQAPREHRCVVALHLQRLRHTIGEQDFDDTERALLADILDHVDQTLQLPDDTPEQR